MTVTELTPPGPGADRLGRARRLGWAGRAGAVLWIAVVVAAVGWGSAAIAPNPAFKVRAAPLFGHWGLDLRLGSVLAVVVAAGAAAGVVGFGPRVAARLPWKGLLPVAAAAGSIWSLALNLPYGWGRLTASHADRHQYEPFAASIDNAGTFLRTFTEEISRYPVHVKGHPPGATLVPWLLDQIGLGGAGWFALLVVAGWGVAIAATLVAVRAVAGESVARRCAPALVLLPGALWATSADGLFAGVSACAVSSAVVALAGRRSLLAALAGVLFALALMLTYGAAALAVIVVAAALYLRAWIPLLIVGASAALALGGVWVLTGFSWLEGLDATRGEYWAGVASRRPSTYFLLAGNPGALALAVGPAVFAGLGMVWAEVRAARSEVRAARSEVRARQDSSVAIAVLPLGALAAVAAADVSLLSKAEVERIWLLFMPWLTVATVALPGRRRWLVVQAVLAVALLIVFRRG